MEWEDVCPTFDRKYQHQHRWTPPPVWAVIFPSIAKNTTYISLENPYYISTWNPQETRQKIPIIQGTQFLECLASTH